jgi:DNA-directed RNA polymerase subunit alpha
MIGTTDIRKTNEENSMDKVEVIFQNELTADEVEQALRAAYANSAERRRLKEVAEQVSGEAKKVLSVLLLWFEPNEGGAIEKARQLKDESETLLYVFLRLSSFTEQIEEASAVLEKAKLSEMKRPLPFYLLLADVKLREGDTQKAAEALEKASSLLPSVSNEEWRKWYEGRIAYLSGCRQEKEGDWFAAIDSYEKAISLAPDMHSAHFRLGYLYDLHGADETAVKHYEMAKRIRPFDIGTLINLGVLYEEMGRYRLAIECYKTVLDVCPAHSRAKLYLKDAEASLKMFYDEEKEAEREKLKKLLATPVSDFELSVRSRNCLKKMNIKNLGDLVQRTETELLAYKNFGETSLSEIKQLLASKGLKLGVKLDELLEQVPEESLQRALKPAIIGQENEDVLSLPVTKLQLSVRARRCIETLNIRTLGELVQKTPQELMSVRNFGQTSLAEVKEQLAKFGLSLREEI